MSTSSHYQFLSDGIWSQGERAGKRRTKASAGADLLTPDIPQLGQAPFTADDEQALAQRLLDKRWPRGSLNICGLEGLLTALLVLPLGLRPATWLPLIWNEPGWRVPPVLGSVEAFNHFIEAIVGFMRSIDQALRDEPPRLASTLVAAAGLAAADVAQARRDWARGFCLAVSESENFKARPDGPIYDALFAIAVQSYPASEQARLGRRSALTMEGAVLGFAKTRATRGPLGALIV